MKNILIFLPNYYPGYLSGGIARSVLNSTNWLGNEFSIYIVTRDRDLGSKTPYSNVCRESWVPVGHAHVRYLAPQQLSLKYLIRLINQTKHDVLHLNSFFDPVFTIKILLLRRLGFIKTGHVLLSPRGEFGWGSLSLKYLKKSSYIKFSRMFGFYRNLLWHASSKFEAEDISKALQIPHDVIRTALDLPINCTQAIFQDKSKLKKNLKIIYLARLTREKNLDGALKLLQRVTMPIDFDIFGPQEDALYWEECQTLMSHLPSHVNATYHGAVSPEQVFNIMVNYDLLLLPSHGENYGHVIAEALSVGTRVLISTLTPWQDLETDELGWACELNDPQGYADIIDMLARTPHEKRVAVRNTVREAAARRFSDSNDLNDNRRLYLMD